MASGYSLHIGINEYSSAFPNAGRLEGAENDARAMSEIAAARHFKPELLLGPRANYPTVISKLLVAAKCLHRGDIFLLTFAGHGTGRRDRDRDEDDRQDEAILLHDVMLLDDELRMKIWPKFEAGVRVLMIADSCHSGTVATFLENRWGPTLREISQETRDKHIEEYNEFYGQIAVPPFAPISANVLLLAACGDRATTPDGNPHGVFTQALLDVINGTNPTNYRDLRQRIEQALRPQIPVLTPVSPVSEDFIRQRPFTI
jgi:hypothetical protein